MRVLVVLVVLSFLPFASVSGVASGSATGAADTAFEPHVVVAVPDTGINPYHQVFYRPDRVDHPCTYIEDFPCDIPALDLSIGTGLSYEEAVDADADEWAKVVPGEWFWVPKTVFVAVYCESPYSSATFTSTRCLLDEHGHGTGTASSIITENPDALLAILGGRSSTDPFLQRGLPIDIFSISWGHVAPLPMPFGTCLKGDMFGDRPQRVYVKGAGNEPGVSSLTDCWSADPAVISVGGAAADRQQEVLAYKEADVVSYFCRPGAVVDQTYGWERKCGTSFGAPTVAGALSGVMLALRRESGYTGGLDGDMVDPLLGVRVGDLRDAMNRTASYYPEDRYGERPSLTIPLNGVAPWLQWGWGFYDGRVAETTIDHLLGGHTAPEKPLVTSAYMSSLYLAREVAYSDPDVDPLRQDDAGSGRDAGRTMATAVPIDVGVVHEGSFGPLDARDIYTFTGRAGDTVELRLRAVEASARLIAPDGTELAYFDSRAGHDAVSPGPASATLHMDGAYQFDLTTRARGDYGFAVSIDASAPEPGLLGLPLPPPV